MNHTDTAGRYCLLGVSTKEVVNIGDYIQALASSQFLPHVDGFIQRERLDEYSGDPVSMIMNGWYMHEPKHWPPSPDINPLFVAFHLNVLAENEMMSPSGIAYLKKHQPIGCRDQRTADVLKKHGIDAYFSGCMTLTLGTKFKSAKRSGKVYFVDPAITMSGRQRFEAVKYMLRHPINVAKLCRRNFSNTDGFVNSLKAPLRMAHLLKTYSTVFSERVILEAEHICQQSSVIKHNHPSEEELFDYAKELVSKYSEAEFVVTSRIHCALPCLGLETPVIYTDFANDSEESKCRFGGLRDLFTCMTWDGIKLTPSFDLKGKIDSSQDFPHNKEGWRVLADRLSTTCREWVDKNKNDGEKL